MIKLSPNIRGLLRRARRRFIVWCRNLFKLDEDIIRDQLLEKAIGDINSLAGAISEMVKQDAEHVGLTQRINGRLSYYEQNIARMRDLRLKYEREQLQKADELHGRSGSFDANGVRVPAPPA